MREEGAVSPADGSADHLREVIRDCVHCGFCLPACPTYQLWGEEMDSPRGRIYLVSQVLDGAELTPAGAEHFDRCLGCMACMTACPSGVQYDQLIEVARVWTEEARAAGGVGGAAGAQPTDDAAGAAGAAVVRGAAGAAAGGAADAAGEAGARGAADAAGEAGARGAGPGVRLGAAGRRVRERAARAAIFSLFPYPGRLRVMTAPLRVAQRTGLDRRLARSTLPGRLSPELGAALRLAPGGPGERGRAPAGGAARGGGAGGGAVRGRAFGSLGPAARGGRLPERVPAVGTRRAVVGMLTGCVQSVFFPQVNAATARVLAAEGCDVIIPRGQGCCGALSLHSGREAEAEAFARRTIDTFEQAGVDMIVVNSAGCGSAMKEYERLMARARRPDLGGPRGLRDPRGEADDGWTERAAGFSAKVRDLAEFLAELGPVAPRHPLPVTAAYHDACHLGHAQGITRQPRDLLRGIPGLKLVELPDAGNCCGSAGVYNLLQPEAARELGARKAEGVLAAGAPLLISANPGCSLQIAAALGDRGERIAVAHTAEVLDASIRGVTPPWATA
jgi:glycolate oxidase iron-sulfur subunit